MNYLFILPSCAKIIRARADLIGSAGGQLRVGDVKNKLFRLFFKLRQSRYQFLVETGSP